MKIMICDDQEQYVEELVERCRAFVSDRGVQAEVCGTTDAEEIFKDIPDLLILDIEMPEVSGIEIKNRLAHGDRPLIIFATNYGERMPEAFGKNVIGFMVKPIHPFQFEVLVQSGIDLLTADTMVSLEDGDRVSSRDILMITVEKGYTQVQLHNGPKKPWTRKSLKVWEEELEDFGFVRISDACLLNCRYIRCFEGYKVKLLDGQLLKVSRRRKESCFEKFLAFAEKTAIH